MYSSMIYYASQNLGDAIQAIALSRWLGPCHGIYRHHLADVHAGEDDMIIAGYLRHPVPSNTSAILAGVYIEQNKVAAEAYKWASNSKHVAARDPVTFARLLPHNARTVFSGCVTLTLPEYTGERKGRYTVDYPQEGCEKRTHFIPKQMPWEEQWSQAIMALGAYATAEVVYTSRLHVALPCLAFGTPVYLTNPKKEHGAPSNYPDRYAIWESLRLPYNEIVKSDVSSWKSKWLGFLEDAIGKVSEGNPVMPQPKREATTPPW